MHGCKCTLCPQENTGTHKLKYITVIDSSSLPRSGFLHIFNATGAAAVDLPHGVKLSYRVTCTVLLQQLYYEDFTN